MKPSTMNCRRPLLALLMALVVMVEGAPRSKSHYRQGSSPDPQPSKPGTVYDQKQTGDYNIQLHLKDFQIIALLSDESLGGLGDYDYNYDYADFTVKPTKPSSENATTTTAQPSTSTTIISTTKKDEELPPPTTTTTTTTERTSSDKIKVQILESPLTGPINIVPSDDLGEMVSTNDAPPLGEILHYRRCSGGYSRDKKGRCRPVRRHGVPFGIRRLASSLAAGLRQQGSTDESADVPN